MWGHVCQLSWIQINFQPGGAWKGSASILDRWKFSQLHKEFTSLVMESTDYGVRRHFIFVPHLVGGAVLCVCVNNQYIQMGIGDGMYGGQTCIPEAVVKN